MKNLRETLKISKKALAERVGLKRQAIYTYEVGKSEPTISILQAIAVELKTSTPYLLGEIDYPHPLPPDATSLLAALDRGDRDAVNDLIANRARQVGSKWRGVPGVDPNVK